MDKVNLFKHLREELSNRYCFSNESMQLGPSICQKEVADYYGVELRQTPTSKYDLEGSRYESKRLLR